MNAFCDEGLLRKEEGGRKGGRKGGREGGREGGRKESREGGREGGRDYYLDNVFGLFIADNYKKGGRGREGRKTVRPHKSWVFFFSSFSELPLPKGICALSASSSGSKEGTFPTSTGSTNKCVAKRASSLCGYPPEYLSATGFSTSVPSCPMPTCTLCVGLHSFGAGFPYILHFCGSLYSSQHKSWHHTSKH